MEEVSLFVLNGNFDIIYLISEFNSLIWTERYWECGDFQLEVIYSQELMSTIKVGHYLSLGDDQNLMLIESIYISYDPSNKTDQIITYKGRTMESLLDRRIIWGQWGSTEKRNIQSIILNLIDSAIINPSNSRRNISYFRTETSSGITGSKCNIAAVGDGTNLYEVCKKLCRTAEVGMRCRYDESTKLITFSLFMGVDHSYDQSVRPPVIFSSTYENLGPSRFSFNTAEYKTVAFAVGPWMTVEHEDPETGEKWTTTTRTELEVGDIGSSGLNRREIFVDGGRDDPTVIADKAMEELASTNTLETLDSELDSKRQFIYGQDFNIGDIVQVITDFGLDKTARITEFIRSWDAQGYTEVPTFEIIEEE